MPQLIQMRKRIKTIETIQKITHAMRLVAMTSHIKLRDREPYIHGYKQSVERLFLPLYTQFSNWKNPILSPEPTNKNLYILVGSQKGLCGSFNNAVFSPFIKKWEMIISQASVKTDLIVVGKKIFDIVCNHKIAPIKHFDTFSALNVISIANEIAQFIISQKDPYGSVIIINNYPKTFFSQKHRFLQLIPINKEAIEKGKGKEPMQDYVWEDDPLIILERLANLHLTVSIQYNLFESVLAEQAARFIAMDSSTRNAKKILEVMHQQYNKLRQTKITKELTELSASFQLNVSS